MCKTRTECKWFTFSTVKGFCYLYENCIMLDAETCPDCISGKKECVVNEPKCEVQGECKGIAEQDESVQTVEECLQLCKSNSGCAWFTFNKLYFHCFLFEICSNIDVSSCGDNCISGQKECIHKGEFLALAYGCNFYTIFKFNYTTIQIYDLKYVTCRWLI